MKTKEKKCHFLTTELTFIKALGQFLCYNANCIVNKLFMILIFISVFSVLNGQSLTIKNSLYRNKVNVKVEYQDDKDQEFYLIGRESKLLKKNKGNITLIFYFDRTYPEIQTHESIPSVLFEKEWFRNMKLEWSHLNGVIYIIHIKPELLDDDYILYLSPLLAQV